MSEQIPKSSSRIVEMSGNMFDFVSAVVGKRGKFCVDVMGVNNPNESQEQGLHGMVQLGIRYYDSLDKINLLVDPIEDLTVQIDSISRDKGEPSSYKNWKKCPKESDYSYSNTFHWK
ncbi:MAG: hypothetical protein AAB705_01875 [Patescibacteria group bacterium]